MLVWRTWPQEVQANFQNQKLGRHMVWKLSIGLLKNIAAFYHDPGSLTLALHAVPVQLHWVRCLSHVCDSLLGAYLFRPAAASNWEVKSWKSTLLETVEPKQAEFKLSISYLKAILACHVTETCNKFKIIYSWHYSSPQWNSMYIIQV